MFTPRFGDLLEVLTQFNFSDGSDGEESACSAGDLHSIPGLGRSLGEGNGYPLQYSSLENSVDRGACWATVQHDSVGHDWETFTHSLIQLRIESYLQLWFITAEGYKAKSAREKAHGQSLEETQRQLPRALSQLSHTGHHSTSSELWQYVWSAVYQVHSSEIQSCWSCGHPLPNTYQKSRLLEGKQVLNTNHVVCTNILDSVSHSHHIGKVLYQCCCLVAKSYLTVLQTHGL